MNKRLKLRWPATCAVCAAELPAKTEAFWNTEAKCACCIGCAEVGEQTAASPPLPTPPVTPLDRGRAGASARREYEKRSLRERERKQAKIDADLEWRKQVKAKVPVLGHVVAAVTPKPTIGPESQPTTAWKTGEAGELRVAEILDGSTIIALHDRRVPKSSANIDHLAIGPAGVFVVDAKKYAGKIEKRDVGGFFKRDDRLYVRGRDRTKLVDGVLEQCDIVRTALGDDLASVDVRGILCFVGAQWPGLRMKPIALRGVTSIWPKGLAKLVETPGPLERTTMDLVARRLSEVLPPA